MKNALASKLKFDNCIKAHNHPKHNILFRKLINIGNDANVNFFNEKMNFISDKINQVNH